VELAVCKRKRLKLRERDLDSQGRARGPALDRTFVPVRSNAAAGSRETLAGAMPSPGPPAIL